MQHTHWHGFRYVGKAYTDPQRRRGEAPTAFPPFVLDEFLTALRTKTADTLADTTAALDWLKQGATSAPPLDQTAFTIEDRLASAERTLRQEVGADVIFGYYTSGQTYVSLSVIACPRLGIGCPTGFQPAP
ncbi:MAG: hypothetical protein LBV60_13770 [Streptomyces sp.]|nr:hypothetical protein [Streptomyces sp.]